MASESSDEQALSVTLPPDVDEWLDEKAAELGVDREAVVVQLLASYRAASELEDDSFALPMGADADVEEAVRDVIADRIPDIAGAVGDELDTADTDAVESRLSAEIDNVENEFRGNLQDVRERVIQVKREADAKADADHTHPEFGELATLSSELDGLQNRLEGLEDRLDSTDAEREDLEARVDALEDVTERLEDAEDKLQTVAWVVSDLRDTVETQAGTDRAIERLRRSAAAADIERAVCDSCEQPVDIALLSEPKCPHCDATVSDVEPPGGFFGKPRLTVAQQLEAGDPNDDSDVPDAARR